MLQTTLGTDIDKVLPHSSLLREIIYRSLNKVEHSHWSRNVEAWLSLVESFKVLTVEIFSWWGSISCLELVLYGIRIVGLRMHGIIGGLYAIKNQRMA